MDPDFDAILQAPPFRSFVEAWRRAGDGRSIPHRQAIRLQDFAGHAQNLSIYERRGTRDLYYRLTGTEVHQRSRIQTDTENIYDRFADDIRAEGEVWGNSMFDTPCGGISESSTVYTNGSNKAGQTIFLPLRGPGGDILMLSLHHVIGVIGVGAPRDHICIGTDYFVGRYIDTGYGVPATGADFVIKPKPTSLMTARQSGDIA